MNVPRYSIHFCTYSLLLLLLVAAMSAVLLGAIKFWANIYNFMENIHIYIGVSEER